LGRKPAAKQVIDVVGYARQMGAAEVGTRERLTILWTAIRVLDGK
jgi:hypothetical protein